MNAFKLLQGYLWVPHELGETVVQTLPEEWAEHPHGQLVEGAIQVLVGAIQSPRAFFENGEPTAGYQFYQVTVVARTLLGSADLKPVSVWASQQLDPVLNATPPQVGWLIMEDLRPV
jgi:hypothetical protein